MEKVCITGGAGFIGSHVVDLLIEKGYDVFVIDNLSTGKRGNLNPSARFYELNILDPLLFDIFMKEKPEIVLHLAAQSNVPVSVERPAFDAQSNILGTINLLETSKKTGVKKIIYSSTGGALYGNPKPSALPCDEKHPVNPLSPYGLSKYVAEKYLSHYPIGFTVLRYSNVYGPRQDPYGEAGVTAIFFEKLRKGAIPIIFGDGEQTRDFVYVRDVALANLKALEQEAKNAAYNIASGKATSINDLLKMMQEITGVRIKPVYKDALPGEVRHIFLSSKKAKEELGWEPATSFLEGLKKTWESFRK